MHSFGTHALAFGLSAFVGGFVQQLLMIAVLEAHGPESALIPLLGIVLAISIVFAIADRRAKTVSGLDITAGCLVGSFALVGAVALMYGYANIAPGIAGDLMYGLALLLDVAFLLPAGVAAAIQWWLLRRRPAPAV